VKPGPSRGSSRSGVERNSARPIGDRSVAAQASAIARWMRSASTARFAGEPSLYFPAVTLPLHPVA
jgi:hypothetical protein